MPYVGAEFLISQARARSVETAFVAIRVRLPGLPKIKTIQIATSYETFDQLAESFHKFCEPEACFVPSKQTRPVGTEAVFAIQLVSGEPVLRGTCTVDAVYDAADSPFGRPGLRLAIKKLTSDSKARYAEILARGSAPIPVLDNELTVKNEYEPAYSARETTAMAPMVPEPADVELREPEPRLKKIATKLGFAPLRQPAAPSLPLRISSAPTRVPRGVLGRMRDAIIRLCRRAVSWRSQPSLPGEATHVGSLRSSSR